MSRDREVSLKRVWGCIDCDGRFEETEWRGFNTDFQMPICDVCGEMKWVTAGFKVCPVGTLFLMDEIGYE